MFLLYCNLAKRAQRDNFNRPFRGVRLKDDAFIEDLMALAKDTRDRYASIKAKRDVIDDFTKGNI